MREVADGPSEALRAVVVPFLAQRALLFLVAVLALGSVPFQQDTWHPTPGSLLLEPWFRYDASWYLDIAYRGYANPESARFFPGYPWLVRVVALVLPLPLAAFVAANGALLGGLLVFHRFLRTRLDTEGARQAVLLLLVFPASLFFSAAYSESTYFLSLSMALLGWATGRPWLAAAGVLWGTLTRPVGALCLTLPFVVEWLVRSRRLETVPWFVLAAVPAGALVVANHWLAAGDPWAFAKAGVHSAHGVYQGLTEERMLSILRREGMGAPLGRRLVNWSMLALALAAAFSLYRRGQLVPALVTLLSVGVPLAVQRTLFDAGSMGRYLLGGAPFVLALVDWCSGREERSRVLLGGFALAQAALVTALAAWVWTE